MGIEGGAPSDEMVWPVVLARLGQRFVGMPDYCGCRQDRAGFEDVAMNEAKIGWRSTGADY